jgi:hypothetical protein
MSRNLRMQGDYLGAEAVLDSAPNYQALSDSPETGTSFERKWASSRLRLSRALIQIAAGNAPLALELLAPASFDKSSLFKATLGEALCAANRHGEGLRLLRQALEYDEKNDHFPHAPQLARLRAVTGACALATGDRVNALVLAKQARASFTAQPGVSPWFKAPLFKLERALGLKLPPV